MILASPRDLFKYQILTITCGIMFRGGPTNSLGGGGVSGQEF